MKQRIINVYSFDELSDKAKEKALDEFRMMDNFTWQRDYNDSLSAFLDQFGASLMEYNIDMASIDVSIDNSAFRGVKLKEFKPDYMPTGFCADCELWETFYNEFKRTGDAKHAFFDALQNFMFTFRKDYEFSYSDEFLIDMIEANEYEFDADGNLI